MWGLKLTTGQQIKLKWDHYLLLIIYYVIDIFTKYASAKHLKDKNVPTVLHDFIEILKEFKRKPNKLWVGRGRKFRNNIL